MVLPCSLSALHNLFLYSNPSNSRRERQLMAIEIETNMVFSRFPPILKTAKYSRFIFAEAKSLNPPPGPQEQPTSNQI